MTGILISRPLEFPPVCCGLQRATAGSCSYDTNTYFPTFLHHAEKLALPSGAHIRHLFPSFVSAFVFLMLVTDDLAR